MPTSLPQLELDPQAKLSDLIHDPDFRFRLARVLSSYLATARWFTSKGKTISEVRIEHAFELSEQTALLVLAVNFNDQSQEYYQLPLAWNWEPEWLADLQDFNAHLAIAQIGDPARVILSDAINRSSFRTALFRLMLNANKTDHALTSDLGRLVKHIDQDQINSVVPALDTSNTAIIYQDQFFYKLFRKLDVGLNPDLELVRFLSEHTPFSHSPRYAGSLSLGSMNDERFINLGICIGKIENRGDAWGLFQDLTANFYARVIDYGPERLPASQLHSQFSDLPDDQQQLIGRQTYERVELLARRTAEMHLALASADASRPELEPEELSADYRAEISQAALRLFERQLQQLAQQVDQLKPQQQALARQVIAAEDKIKNRLTTLSDRAMNGKLIRIHGDYHLGQVLYDEQDFYIIDFEGEPLLSIPERRRKRPAFKDVAGMIRSLHYAASGQLLLNIKYRPAEVQQLKPWGNWWFRNLRTAFLRVYLDTVSTAQLLPDSKQDQELLLDLFVLEKAVYEVAYELNSRPDWLDIPLQGLLFALEDSV